MGDVVLSPSAIILTRLRIGSLFPWEIDALASRLDVPAQRVRDLAAAHERLTKVCTPVQAPLGLGALRLDEGAIVEASRVYNAAAAAVDAVDRVGAEAST